MTKAVLPSVEADARATVKELFAFIEKQGQGDYLGEAVSQVQHSLQTATFAQQANADDETVLGGLLHDVGRFIPAADKMAAMKSTDGRYLGTASHDVLGERYLRELGFSDKICQLVGAHVYAKRYLTGGGPLNEAELQEAQKDPFLEQKLQVRRWDDKAKDPKMETPPLSSFENMAVKSLLKSRSQIELHGRTYNLPTGPTVAVCVDGFDPEYLDQGVADGIIPNLAKLVKQGFHQTAKCAMPSFTNPNNVSIITGVPISVHGISGNYFLDRETGKEEMITDDSLLIGSTILELMSQRGVRVAAVTAKDKLRKILQHGLSGAICFSAEKAGSCTLEENGITEVEKWLGKPQPSQYSGELSLFVMDAGVKLLEEDRADLFYLTLSDYVQHKHAPRSKESNWFLTELDKRIGSLVELGAKVAITGDHGMSDKSKADGSPNVLFLEDALTEKWGAGSARVICPITDPFVRHHGALGSFVRVYTTRKTDIDDMIRYCKTLPEVELALDTQEALERLELRPDREGDIVVVSKKNAVIGSRKDEHDLSNLGEHRLRSHGGLSEQDIPLIMSRPVQEPGTVEGRQWRNFDIYDLLLNY